VRRLIIANRGEIARRILRSARDRSYVVAVISTPADRDALVRTEADDVLEVDSFLDGEAIVAAAEKWNAGFLHPGYGFLSENAGFAERVESAGIVFVGPTAASMKRLGNKETAKKLAEKNGVPTLEAVRSDEPDKLEKLEALGLEPPYLVKAAGGGGGRGMRIVETEEALGATLKRASEEALSGFGDPAVFIERYLPEPRHIEIQVFGDGKGQGVVLGERECSMQRRYQKVIEEAPSPAVDPASREKMGRAALKLVEKTRYRGAGTVEFLLDRDGQFYFLEVNTRLQVEHPVTEAVVDIDLVCCQLELAEGHWPAELPAPESGAILEPKRCAVEARVLAEDPRRGFLPTPGPLHRYREPGGECVRVDSGVSEGGRVHAEFDSMIAKVIAWGETRAEAVERLSFALESFIVHGATTNLPFLQAVLRHPEFRAGRISTSWIARNLDALNGALLPDALARRLQTPGFRERLSFVLRGRVPDAPFASRFGSLSNDVLKVGSSREQSPLNVAGESESGCLQLTGLGLARALSGPSSLRFSRALDRAVDGARRESARVRVEATGTVLSPAEMALTVFGETLRLEDPRASSHRRLRLGASDGDVRAPMAGKVLEVHVEPGAAVEEGELLIVVESMKMQLEIHAPITGRVEKILVEPGQVLEGPDLMAVVAPLNA